MRSAYRHNRWLCLELIAILCLLSSHVRAATYYVIVSGLGGEPDYEQRFTAAAKDLEKIFQTSGLNSHTYMLFGAQATSSNLRSTLTSISLAAKPEDDFVLILIGHGSFDGVTYKFNLVGPDLSSEELAELCNHVQSRRQLIVDTSSASGAAIPSFMHQGRAVVAATKSGTEKNATVFSRYWVQALQDPSADTDKSGSVSALEAFTYATKKTAGFYDALKRLATEHAVFIDTPHGEPVREAGQGEGALMSSITLLRIGNSQQMANDPSKRAVLQKKEELEQKIDTLKYQKAAMDPADYKQQLTELLLELAHTQQELDK